MADDDAKARYRAALEKLTRSLADQGLLIEAGWVSCRRMTLLPDAPSVQVDTCRTMFFAGAQHLWGAVAGSMLDPDAEPTEADMRRLSLIDSELRQFLAVFAAQHGIKLDSDEPRRGKPS